MSRIISYLLILIGAMVATYARAGEAQNQYLLIGGIVALMMGIYRISKHIPSKRQEHDNKNDSDL